MQHAIARQAEAERERRAKIINAEGEYQAAAKLAQAADVIGQNPTTIQLRYLQTLREMGAQSSTIVFPMPIDLMKPVAEALGQSTTSEPQSGDHATPELEAEGARELGTRSGHPVGAPERPGERSSVPSESRQSGYQDR